MHQFYNGKDVNVKKKTGNIWSYKSTLFSCQENIMLYFYRDGKEKMKWVVYF